MRLQDRVEVIELRKTGERDRLGVPIVVKVSLGTFPAHVTYKDTSLDTGTRYVLSSTLTVVMREAWINTNHNIKWRGVEYVPDGEPRKHMRGNRVHHVSFQVKVVTG